MNRETHIAMNLGKALGQGLLTYTQAFRIMRDAGLETDTPHMRTVVELEASWNGLSVDEELVAERADVSIEYVRGKIEEWKEQQEHNPHYWAML